MSGGRVTDHRLSMGYTGVPVSRSDYVRMPVEFHVEIATLFPSALSLFLFLFMSLSSAGAGNPTSSYDDGDAENNEVLRYER